MRIKLEPRANETDFTSYMKMGYQSPYVLKNRKTDIMYRKKVAI